VTGRGAVTRPTRLYTGLQVSLATFATIALVLFALAEVGLGWVVAWWLYLALIAASAVALLRWRPLTAQRAQVTAFVVVSALIGLLYLVPWTSRKPFLRDLYSIEIGMDEAQVRQIMDGYIEGTGWPVRVPGATQDVQQVIDPMGGGTYATAPTAAGEMGIADSIVFRHSTDAHFNSDWGIVKFQDGRVVDVSFSPD
jgi:membrane protein implicated in regulation of membrane protease activity